MIVPPSSLPFYSFSCPSADINKEDICFWFLKTMMLVLTDNNHQTNFLVFEFPFLAWLAETAGSFVCPDSHFHPDTPLNCDSTRHLAEGLKSKRTENKSLDFSSGVIHFFFSQFKKKSNNNISNMMNLTSNTLLAFVALLTGSACSAFTSTTPATKSTYVPDGLTKEQ
jgi:hypothetical protein